MNEGLATESEIVELLRRIEGDDVDDVGPIDALLERYPQDARLHFMRGSVLAGRQRPIEAHQAMRRAVEIAPGYALARYQLGFFELTSGEPEAALSTWGPLLAEPADNPLRIFVEGMTHLIRDEFGPALSRFEEGIARNLDNEPLNNDVRLLMGEVRKLADSRVEAAGAASDDLSATSLILGQFAGNRTLN